MTHELNNEAHACPECGSTDAWDGSSWCLSCGYYPAISQESESSTGFDDDASDEPWWQLIPNWAYVLVTGIVAIAAISLAVRLMFSTSPVRTWWTVGQIGVGIIVFGVVHLMAYFYGFSRTDKLGPLDVVFRPLATWQPVLNDLPTSSNLVCYACFSVAAIACGYYIVDGIDYNAILEAEADARERRRLQQLEQQAEDNTQMINDLRMLMRTACVAAPMQQSGCPTVAASPGQSMTMALAKRYPATVGNHPTDTTDLKYAAVERRLFSSSMMKFPTGTTMATMGPAAAGGFTGSGMSDTNARNRSGRDNLLSFHPAGSKPALGNIYLGPGSAVSSSKFGGRTPMSAGGSTDAASDDRTAYQDVECLVLGYTTNATGEIRSILLASAPERKLLRFVGKVPIAQVAPEVLSGLLANFSEIPASKPMVRCPYGGRWVQPVLFCLVDFDGWTADNRMNNVQVTRLMNTQAQ